jgi:hypothetical protein
MQARPCVDRNKSFPHKSQSAVEQSVSRKSTHPEKLLEFKERNCKALDVDKDKGIGPLKSLLVSASFPRAGSSK